MLLNGKGLICTSILDHVAQYTETKSKMCFSKYETPILFDNLGQPLDLAYTDRSLWNDKCDYCETLEINNLNSNGKNLTVLQLNIGSLLGKQNELNLLLNELHKHKSLPKLLILSETHLE